MLKEALAEFPVMTTASGIISLDIPGAPGDQMVPFTVADRAAVTEALVRVAEVDVRARMRIVTVPGTLAEASVERPGARTAVNVRVMESQPGPEVRRAAGGGRCMVHGTARRGAIALGCGAKGPSSPHSRGVRARLLAGRAASAVARGRCP